MRPQRDCPDYEKCVTAASDAAALMSTVEGAPAEHVKNLGTIIMELARDVNMGWSTWPERIRPASQQKADTLVAVREIQKAVKHLVDILRFRMTEDNSQTIYARQKYDNNRYRLNQLAMTDPARLLAGGHRPVDDRPVFINRDVAIKEEEGIKEEPMDDYSFVHQQQQGHMPGIVKEEDGWDAGEGSSTMPFSSCGSSGLPGASTAAPIVRVIRPSIVSTRPLNLVAGTSLAAYRRSRNSYTTKNTQTICDLCGYPTSFYFNTPKDPALARVFYSNLARLPQKQLDRVDELIERNVSGIVCRSHFKKPAALTPQERKEKMNQLMLKNQSLQTKTYETIADSLQLQPAMPNVKPLYPMQRWSARRQANQPADSGRMEGEIKLEDNGEDNVDEANSGI